MHGDPKANKHIRNVLICLLNMGDYLGLLGKKKNGSARAFLIKQGSWDLERATGELHNDPSDEPCCSLVQLYFLGQETNSVRKAKKG